MDIQAQARTYVTQFTATLSKIREAVDFSYRHRLWEGFWRYGWVAKFLIVVAVIAGLKFLSLFVNWFSHTDPTNPAAMISSMGTLFQSVAREGYQFLFFGGMKYVLIVLMEVVIFHVCRRTLFLLAGKAEEATFQAFVRAQVRMIKIVIRSYALEMVATMVIKLFFNFYGFIDFLQPLAIFVVQCYYVGFALLDNYFEQFGFTIRDSVKEARRYIGVALAIGLFLQAALAIPVAGTVAGPFLAAVAVTLAMHELSDLHRRPRPRPVMGADEVV